MSSKRRRVIKQRTPTTVLESKVNKANLRLKQLEKAGFKDSWASRKLYDYLSGGKLNIITKKTNRINIKNKKLTKVQRRLIDKRITNFMRSETSTPAGIENVRQRTIKTLQHTLSGEIGELSYEEAEAYYNMLGDSDFRDLAELVGASEMWIMISDATDYGDSATTFLTRVNANLGSMIDINDDDMKEKLLRVYDKYVV